MRRLTRDVLPVLAVFFRERPWLLLAGAALAATTVLAGIALLGLSGWFITATAIAGLSTATALAFDVFAPSAGIRFLAFARTGARYGERLATHEATLAVLAALRERLFRGWATPGLARQLALRPSSLLNRLTADIDALDGLYLRILVPAAATIVAAIVAGIVLGSLSLWLGIGIAAALLLTGIAVPIWTARRSLRPARLRAFAVEALRSRTIDLLSGQTDLLLAGRQDAQKAAIADADRRMAEADDTLNRTEALTIFAFGAAGALILAATLAAATLLADTGAIGAPAATLAVLIAFAALEPFTGLRRGALELGRTLLAAGRLAPRLKTTSSQAPHPAPRTGVALSLADVSVRVDGIGRAILSDVTLQLEEGERVALVGPSGSGKSTLLGVIAGEVAPTTGHVANATATLLTQRTELFRDTLAENLILAAADADDARLWAALSAAGLRNEVAALPDGLDTRLGEAGLGLSGGQARRLSLARLVLRDTPLWLIDEPTEGLDGATARDVLARLTRESRGRTLLVATHVRREAAICDRIVLLNDGGIVSDHRRGSPEFDTTLAGLRPD
ncbi:amino acid ABC transporter ATP-binding/permease protein [Amorphus sp. 3PC139-8]|uniref:amino acid ABC transporter ATP-binding/permease protein n=1 Tax=Amorphus sp. 3PC139-8 TaxID=2735676 RepID=UPI00345C882C